MEGGTCSFLSSVERQEREVGGPGSTRSCYAVGFGAVVGMECVSAG